MIFMKNPSKSWFPWQIDETLRGGEKYILFFRRLQSPTPSVEAVFATAYRIYVFTISTPKLNKILLILSNVYKFVPFYRSPSLFYISEKGSISVKMQASKQASKQSKAKQSKQASKQKYMISMKKLGFRRKSMENPWFPLKNYKKYMIFMKNQSKINTFKKNPWFLWKIYDFHENSIKNPLFPIKIHKKSMIFNTNPSKIHNSHKQSSRNPWFPWKLH